MIEMPFVEDLPFWTQSLVNGFVGGIIYVLIQKWGWNDLEAIERRLLMGLIAGYITHVTGHTDAFTTIVAGYVGIDSLEGFINHRVRPATETEKQKI